MKTQSIGRELVALGALLAGCGSGAATTEPSPAAATEGMRAAGSAASSGGDAGCATPPETCVATGPLSLWAWGANTSAQVAPDPTHPDLQPAQVAVPSPTLVPHAPANIVMLAAGGAHNLALDADGNVWGWGLNGCGQTGVRPADSATDTSCFWDTSLVAEPTLVLSGAKSIAAGYLSSAALMNDGTVVTWGYNLAGQLGTGQNDYVPHWLPTRPALPTPVTLPTGPLPRMTSLYAGVYQVIAVADDGHVWGWGDNYHGELALPTPGYPIAPTILSAVPADARGVTAGGLHTYYVQDGNVWGFGGFFNPDVGGTAATSRTPLHIPGPSGIRKVASGAYFGLALGSDGELWSWGDQEEGELGYDAPPGPGRITSLPAPMVDVWASDNSGFSLDTTGQLWAWGRTDYGELGAGPLPGGGSLPVRVSRITGVSLFSANGEHNLAYAYACEPLPPSP